MKRNYKLSDTGNVQVINMLKEIISSCATKISRYEKKETTLPSDITEYYI